MDLLTQSDDVLSAILGHADPESLVAFACTCSTAAVAVRRNRKGIVACRSPEFFGRVRALKDLRELFPDVSDADRFPDHYPRTLEESTTAWLAPEPGETEVCVWDFHASDRDPWCMSSCRQRTTLDALSVPVSAERVKLCLGRQVVADVPGVVLRAVAVDGAQTVDIVPFTIGTHFAMGAACYQNTDVVVTGPDASVVATFTRVPWFHPMGSACVRVMSLRSEGPHALKNDFWYRYSLPSLHVEALHVLIENERGEIVDDVLETITVQNMHAQKTFQACALRQPVPSLSPVLKGYTLPILTRHNFSRSSLRFRLTLRAGGPDASRASLYRVTFAHAQETFVRTLQGYAGLVYAT